MDIEKRKKEFQKHHKNTFNIYFHIGCGLVYMGLLLSLLPAPFLWIYFLLTLFLFPSGVVLFGLLVLYGIVQFIKTSKLSIGLRIVLILVVYFLPEVSHWLTKEETVLQMDSMTVFDAVDNFFFLLPQSLLSAVQ